MRTPDQIAASFRLLDLHDDTVGSILVRPYSGHASACIEVTLCRHWENKQRLLRFIGCENVGLEVDTHVLRRNAASNTSHVSASTSLAAIRRVMRRHKPAWNVTYERSIDPLPGKLASANALVLFEVGLFGGTLQVVARSYQIRRTTERSS